MASYDDTATVSGSVVSFPNGADDVPTKSLVVTIPPTLDGVSLLTVMRTGRNLFDISTATNGQINGTNGVYYANANWQASDFFPVHGANLTLSWDTDSSNYYQVNLAFYDSEEHYVDGSNNTFANIYSKTFTIPSGAVYCRASWSISVGGSPAPRNNIRINLGSTDGGYTPYTSPTTYTASLGRTIYGGTADIVNGQGTEQGYKIVIDGTNIYFSKQGNYYNSYPRPLPTLGNPWKLLQSDNISFGYNSTYGFVFLTVARAEELGLYSAEEVNAYFAQNPTTIILNLATPTDFTFTGQEIPTKLGYNAFWSDSGDTELTYYKDGYGFTSVTVNRTGKNLLPNNIENGLTGGITYAKNIDGSISCSGTVSNINSTRLISTVKLPVGNYILHGADSNIALRATLYDSDGTVITNRNDTGRGVTVSIDSSVSYVEFRIKARTNAEEVSTTVYPMLETGSTASAYEEYSGVSQTAYLHKVIYGGTADVVKGTCEPKNLIPFEPISEYTYLGITYTQYSDGTVKINGTASGGLSFYRVVPNGSDGVHFKSGVTYTLSGCVGGSSTTYQLDLRVGNSVVGYYKNAIDYGRGYTFTATEDSVAYPLICVRNGTTVNNVIISPMVEVGSSASEYTPHFDPFTFPPISMGTDEGENTLFANEGASAITYRKETD